MSHHGSQFSAEGMTVKEVFRIIWRYRIFAGLLILTSLIFGGVFLYISEPLYQSSGQILIEPSNSSLLTDKLSNMYDNKTSLLTINDAMIRLKSNGITDSVIVKTSSFINIGIPREYLNKIKYFSATPPHMPMVLTVIPSEKPDSDFLVISNTGSLVGRGSFNKIFKSSNFSMILSDMKPVKGFDIILEPIKDVRKRIVGSLKVSNTRDTNVIEISSTSLDREKSKAIVNSYMAELYSQDLSDKQKSATSVKQFLENQLIGVSSNLNKTEESYLKSKISTGIVALDQQTNQYVDMQRHLEEKRIDYEIKLQEATVSKERTTAILKGETDLQDLSKYTSSPFFQQENGILEKLYSKIGELGVENAKLKSQYNESHPLVRQSDAQLEAARKQLDDAVATTVSNATKGVDPLLKPIVENQLLNQINVKVYRELLDQVKKEISNVNRSLSRLPQSVMDKSRYDRDITVNTQIHDLLLTRLEEARIMEASAFSDIKIINWAETPLSPISPQKSKILLLALFAGFFLSGFMIFGIENLRSSFDSAESVENALQAPVLGLIPRFSNNGSNERKIMVEPEKNDGYSKLQMYELFNSLLVNLLSSHDFIAEKVCIVSSTLANEGKSIISANLAVTMARSGKKVLLIDCDFRKPVQHTIFGVQNTNGFVDWIKNNSTKGFLKTAYKNLIFLPSGTIGDSSVSELFHDINMFESIKKLESSFDLIVIDSPPLMLYSDAMILSSHFKNVLLVVKSNTKEEDALKSKKILDKVGARISGVVVNNVKRSVLLGNSYNYKLGYGYGYGYGYAKEIEKKI
jgi:polysaccharide biosynthesis transport protein